MPNGYMVIGTKFQPFSYDEMLKPLAAYTNEYNAQEAAYGELANQAAQWEKLKNSQIDQDTYNQYREYADALQSAANALSSDGLKPGGRKALQGVRKRYIEQIAPIEEAYKRRGEIAQLQEKQAASDPTALFNRRAQEVALKELISNPEMSIASTSGAYLEKSAAQAANALSKQMRDDPKHWKSILGNQYYESRLRSGYTAKEIQDAISGSPTAPRELVDVMGQVIQPIANWDNKEALRSAVNYIGRGMWNAIGEDKYQTVQNQAYMDPLQSLKYKAALGATGDSQRTELPMEPGTTILQPIDSKYTDAVNYKSTGAHSKQYLDDLKKRDEISSKLDEFRKENPDAEKYVRWNRAHQTKDLNILQAVGAANNPNPYPKGSAGAYKVMSLMKDLDKVNSRIQNYDKGLQDYDAYLTEKYGNTTTGYAIESTLSGMVDPHYKMNLPEESLRNIVSSFNSNNVTELKPSGKEISVDQNTITSIQDALVKRTANLVNTSNGVKIRMGDKLYDYKGGSQNYRDLSASSKDLTEFMTDWRKSTNTNPKQISEDIVIQNKLVDGQIVKEIIDTNTGRILQITGEQFSKNPKIYNKLLEQITAGKSVKLAEEYLNIASSTGTNDNLFRPGYYE